MSKFTDAHGDALVTREVAARMLGVHPDTVSRWVRLRRNLKPVRIEGGSIVHAFWKSDVEALILRRADMVVSNA